MHPNSLSGSVILVLCCFYRHSTNTGELTGREPINNSPLFANAKRQPWLSGDLRTEPAYRYFKVSLVRPQREQPGHSRVRVVDPRPRLEPQTTRMGTLT